ncbi:MAG: hypothetical protein J6S50_00740 [Oscillospiraceae bacterium]|nr:hypothetical protein [Oscillospiraceae bacterium]
MFLFLFAVVLVVVAALIFVFTKDRDEDAAYPDEALQEEETEYRKKKSEARIQNPASEEVLPEVDWLEELIAEPAEPMKGRHEAKELPRKQPQADAEILPWEPPEKNPHKDTVNTAATKKAPEKKKEYYGTLKPFLPEEKEPEPREKVSPLITALEIICGFSAVIAFITMIIAWAVQVAKTRGF